ncbi:hypothetical protein OWV82_015124 [Melia azedarach]|uniref:Uncharacterized protein n=1 Tax=Melia azedarach TaxID=155640 RepID=A0ACC1XRP0_MELAZ|nr:hypothetical protein OWV82_015124 [Melia azedarach]
MNMLNDVRRHWYVNREDVEMLPLELMLLYKDKQHSARLIYPDEYMFKNLKIDAVKITRFDGDKCYAKFNFEAIDPTISEMTKVTNDDELMSIYKSHDRMRSRRVEVHVSHIVLEQNQPYSL